MIITWVVGWCWRCETDEVPVTWLGPVQTEMYGTGPFFVCEACLERLEALVYAYNRQVDQWA
ncbi:hypothetical protein GCM10010387_15280 [Streptomyces inusitatus]|uniref:Uncharacterized protein n=1 Tax=Streptomyces inusitatus TaxID=68221 RepID=A0A918PW73_9ACTN|nr:hypothetical protein [Streptomyces inusitatus]GGZ23128.1 hypothetical protein GCM10010387_15280 [Streptomyces inusitatus]